MTGMLRFLGRAAIAGTAASVTSGLALAVAAKAEGRGAWRPLNATSHWRHGPDAAEVRTADATHTGTGAATHYAACVFWAVLFEGWAGRRRPLASVPLVRDAAAMSAVAAAVDYLATPKRFTPGWEYVLNRRSMALAYAAMGAGLAWGAFAADRIDALRGR